MREDGKKENVRLLNVNCTQDLLSKLGGNLFQLVRVAANRALELDAGKPALVPFLASEKVTTIALREIAQGKVVLKVK